MKEEQSVRAVRSYLEAVNEACRSRLHDLLAPDAVFIHRPNGKTIRGAEAVAASFIEWRNEFSELSSEIFDIFGTDDRVVAQIRWRGHHTASGRLVDFLGCCAYTLSGEKLIEIVDYYDKASYQAQIESASD